MRMKSIAIEAVPSGAWAAFVNGDEQDWFGWLAAKTGVTLSERVLTAELASKTVTTFVGE